jgi:membrane protein DedA with SNARE-associated domain
MCDNSTHRGAPNRVTALIAQYGLLIVGAVILLGELGFPTLIPGEIALLVAGSQLIHSLPALLAAILCFGVLDLIATTTLHCAARSGGHRILMHLLRFVLRDQSRGEEMLARWRRHLGGRDSAVVFVTRMLPMLRLYASITTGLLRIRLRDFLTGAVPASLLWAAYPLVLGYILRGHIQGIESHYALVMEATVALSVAVALYAATVWVLRRKTLSAQALRRIRVVLGSATVCGAAARLGLVIAGDGVGRPQLPIPPLPTLSIWSGSLIGLALGLVLLLAHDVRHIRRGERCAAAGTLSGIVWLGFVVLIAAFTSVIGVQPQSL